MQPSKKREIIATLLRQGRPDLANKMATAYHPLVGTTIWGKDSTIHFWVGVARLEEYRPDKPRGKKAKVIEISEWDDALKRDPDFQKPLKQFLSALKSKSWKQAWPTFKQAIDKHNAGNKQEYRGEIKVTERDQRGIDAPAPLDELNAPKNYVNKFKVKINVDPREKAVHLEDMNDKANEPRAFTQGPTAFKTAAATFDEWKDLKYREILSWWGKNKIKYHDYLAMD
jgi:hypothetical protein